ncbi:beta-microseminoprotein J1-like [Alosa sapidissima]|uniref:beta-microseminoprotein J1-like n=1 Tax=Alosa sapidissima TaxID=34773 RepID=UPI001C084609|nr:beta-microseminoprotein J1-like [Alosa sapidissima]
MPFSGKTKPSVVGYLLHQGLLAQFDTMVSAALLVVLCTLPSLAHAACLSTRRAPEMDRACRDFDNSLHEVGSKWRVHCMDCTCSASGIHCCDVLPTSISFPDDCKEVYDEANCNRYAVRKDDPSIKCRIIGGIGK